MKKKIAIISLGCPKNQCDAELMLYTLAQAGYQPVEDVAKADCAIVNTCGFIESAKSESIEEILELGRLKAEGTIKSIVVTGCMAERYIDEILEQLPEVDCVVGIGANGRIADAVAAALEGKRECLRGEKRDMPMEGGRIQTTPHYYAYLRIADGCDNCCTYCAIPGIRGGYRSRPADAVVEEAARLAASGVRELIIVAQDVTRYGEDTGECDLAALLERLCEIDGLVRIRLLYCYPDRVTDRLLGVIAAQPKICKYMDLPLQHCNKDILAAMNRSGSRESLLELIAHIRDMVPGIALRTTLMVGFPGETEEQFTELCEFVREAKFERLGCFVYSPEEGTPAYDFDGRIDPEVAERRQEVVMDEQQRAVEARCESMVGQVIDVMVEGYDRLAECCYGRSEADAPDIDAKVFFTSTGELMQAGDIVRVRIDDYMDCDLVGKRV